MIRILKSEFYKIRHTWIGWAHLIIGVLYPVIFYIGAKTTSLKNFEDILIIKSYLVLLGVGLEIISGLITSKLVDMEVSAGHFQVLLSTTRPRSKAYTAKLLALLIGSLFLISLAIGIFGFLFGQESVGEWLIEVFLIFIGSLAVYMIHLFISIALGGVASIGLGFVESLIALLSMTVLGDKIWCFLPCTWASRLSATYILRRKLVDISYLNNELIMWTYIAIPIIILIFIASLLFFNRWDGKSFSD